MESRPRYFVALFVFCFVGAANGDFLGGLFFFAVTWRRGTLRCAARLVAKEMRTQKQGEPPLEENEVFV